MSKKCDLNVQTWSTNDSPKVPVVLEAVRIIISQLFRYKLRIDFYCLPKTIPGVAAD